MQGFNGIIIPIVSFQRQEHARTIHHTVHFVIAKCAGDLVAALHQTGITPSLPRPITPISTHVAPRGPGFSGQPRLGRGAIGLKTLRAVASSEKNCGQKKREELHCAVLSPSSTSSQAENLLVQ